MKNTIKLQTIALNMKNYTRVTSNTVDTDLYDVNDYIKSNAYTYYANKSNTRGVAKSIQRLVS